MSTCWLHFNHEGLVLVNFKESGINISAICFKDTLDKLHRSRLHRINDPECLQVYDFVARQCSSACHEHYAGSINVKKLESSGTLSLQPQSVTLWFPFVQTIKESSKWTMITLMQTWWLWWPNILVSKKKVSCVWMVSIISPSMSGNLIWLILATPVHACFITIALFQFWNTYWCIFVLLQYSYWNWLHFIMSYIYCLNPNDLIIFAYLIWTH